MCSGQEGVARLFVGGMRPVGSKGCVPDQGVTVITDGLNDGKEDARESQAVQAILGALHESLFFHSVPVTT